MKVTTSWRLVTWPRPRACPLLVERCPGLLRITTQSSSSSELWTYAPDISPWQPQVFGDMPKPSSLSPHSQIHWPPI